MRLNEITFDWKDRIHDTGDILYARNPQSHKIVQVTVTDGNFMGRQYQVTYGGDPGGGGNGGMWAANNEDLFKTREAAESAMFLKQLARKNK